MSAANAKWLDDVAHASDQMYTDGDFPTLAPNFATPGQRGNPKGGGGASVTPLAWSAAFVLVYDWQWRRYADLQLAAKHYDKARTFVDLLAKHADPITHVLPVTYGGGRLGDW